MPTYDLDTSSVRNMRTTPTMIADVLRGAIMSGHLPGGIPLRQIELSEQFGSSRIPVREALRQLEGEGLVTIVPHRGAIVSTLSLEDLRDICEIRMSLETTALRLAIPYFDENTLSNAESILKEMDASGKSPEQWSPNNWRFHSTLYAPANRPRRQAMIKTLYDQVDRYLRLHVALLDQRESAQRDHWELLKACRRGDVEAAVAVLERDVEMVDTLGQYLPHENGHE